MGICTGVVGRVEVRIVANWGTRESAAEVYQGEESMGFKWRFLSGVAR